MIADERKPQKPRRKQPSFSSSLLDAIYRSIDETAPQNEQPESRDSKRNDGPQMEREIDSLRRAIMIEKWIQTHRTSANSSDYPAHVPSSSSGSSTESSMFSPTETESSASKSTPKQLSLPEARKPPETGPKPDGKLKIAKLRARKIYGELKKAREPISPGGRISNFLNSIFSPRNSKSNPGREEWSGNSVMKSRSVNETRTTGSFASRSCLSKCQFSSRGNSNINSNVIDTKKSKSTRSVRFCPASEDFHPDKGLYREEYSTGRPGPVIDSLCIKKNVASLRLHEAKNTKKHEFRDNYCYYHHQKEECEFDDMMSCASSDLFELENIGRAGMGGYEEELPVYGTTSFKMNQVVNGGFVM